MNSEKTYESACPIARSLAFAGDAWSLLILRDAHAGLTRFDQFRKSLGIAPTILTRRLAALTEEGLLEKRRYSEHPPREEYLLTPAGQDFLPVLFIIGAWGRKHSIAVAAKPAIPMSQSPIGTPCAGCFIHSRPNHAAVATVALPASIHAALEA